MKKNMKVSSMLVQTIKKIIMSAFVCLFTFYSVMPAVAQSNPAVVLHSVSKRLQAVGKVFKQRSQDHKNFRSLSIDEKEKKIEESEGIAKQCELELAFIKKACSSDELKLRYKTVKEEIRKLEHSFSDTRTSLEMLREIDSRYKRYVKKFFSTGLAHLEIPQEIPNIEQMSADEATEFLQGTKREIRVFLEKKAKDAVASIRAEDSKPPTEYWAKMAHSFIAGARQNWASPEELERMADLTAKKFAEGVIAVLDEQGEEAAGSFGDALTKQSKKLIKAAGEASNREIDRISRTAADNLEEAGQDLLKDAKTTVTDMGNSVNVAQEKFMKQFIGWGSAGLVTFGVIGIGVWAAYRYAAMGMKEFEKPSVVSETNIQAFKKGFGSFFRLGHLDDEERAYPLFSDIVLDEATKQELLTLKFAINNIKKSKGFFRNIILWGNPGTGKSMSAKALANETDCNWMYLTGSSLSKMEKTSDALQEVDAIFKFAQAQDKPTMIIFDEAELLFLEREKLSENARKIMMHIMSKMGTESNKVIIVAGTNKPEAFDEAMRSRFSKKVEVKLPGVEQRVGILKQYIERDFVQRQDQLNVFDDALVNSIALMTKGFSGRSLMSLVAAIRDNFDSSGLKELTPEFIFSVVRKEVEESLKEQQGFKRETVLS